MGFAQIYVSFSEQASCLLIRYDTIEEFNVDLKAEY